MSEFLYSIDKAIFLFINHTLSNPVTDFLWPLITDYDKLWAVRIPLVIMWLLLLFRGGKTGITVAVMIIPVLFLSDKISSAFIKEWVGRLRPCAEINGVPIVQGIHMLVECGPGRSFPSSHAVNNFAVGTLFSYYYPKWKWGFLGWASLVALSRPAVGVHYPSDILGGAIVGSAVSLLVIWTWQNLERQLHPENRRSNGEGKSQ